MQSGVYEIVNQVNGKRYIGSAINLDARKKQHFHTLKSGRNHNIKLQRAYNKYGKDNFVFREIVLCGKNNAVHWEQLAIDALSPEYNICKVAGSTLGIKYTEQGRKNVSNALKGKRKGIKRNPSSVAKTAAAHIGTKRSEETKQKISAARLGRKMPPRSTEHREKISLAQKGRQKSAEHMASLQAGRAKRVYTAEQREKISIALKEAYASGKRTRIKSEEHKNKIGMFYADLNDEQVREIRNLYAGGMSGAAIARKFKKPNSTILQIVKLKRYKWVK